MTETYREFKVLRALHETDEPIIKAELQRRTKMNYSTVTGAIESLEEKSFVKVHRYGSTRRKFTMIELNRGHPGIQGLIKFFEESE